MSTPVIMRVCESCVRDPDLRAAVLNAQSTSTDLLKVVFVDCLNVCEKEPAIKLGNDTLAPATRNALAKKLADLLAEER